MHKRFIVIKVITKKKWRTKEPVKYMKSNRFNVVGEDAGFSFLQNKAFNQDGDTKQRRIDRLIMIFQQKNLGFQWGYI